MNKDEYEQLKKDIDYHMNRYYNLDEPEISDEEYDQRMQQLKKAEKENPSWITPDSPTQKIGGTVKREAGVKVTHNIPMLSIEDVFDEESVGDWVLKVQKLHPDAVFSVEQKIDGLSMTLRYEDGKLVLAETRGDGFIGEDVTANARVIGDVKQKLKKDIPYLEIRGEVYMSHEDFEKYNEMQEQNGAKEAANPRNLAAGTLRQLDTAITRDRGLKMFVFNIQKAPDEIMENHVQGLDWLESMGIRTVYHTLCTTRDEVILAIRKIGEMRNDLPYDIDGAVVKINQTAYRNDFPAGSKYSSGHIAFKYPPEEKKVVLSSVEETVGRTGKLGFIGHVYDEETKKPARLCGTNVAKVTLHNQDYIREMKLGVGGVYLLKKSGDIIPKICGIVREPEKVYQASKNCPVCGQPLVHEEDTADIRCINPSCPAQLTRTISYFASLNCMNILGFGEKYVDGLIREGYLKDYADIYTLKESREKLIEKGLIGKEKNTDKLLLAIEDSKTRGPVRLLTALGIRNVGRRTARDLMQHFRSMEELMEASEEQLVSIPDIGDTTAKCLVSFFQNPQNLFVIEKMKKANVQMATENAEENTGILEGKTFVVTGTLPTLGRKEMEELILKNGGKATGSVSKKTSYLIAGEAAGSKLKKAEELNIPVLTEKNFLDMLQKKE